VGAAVDPAGLLTQLIIGAAQRRRLLLLYQRVFLADLIQILQQLL